MAIAAVNRNRASGAAGSTTIATLGQSLTAANLIVVWIQWQGTTFSSIADTAGNTWTQAGSQYDPGSNHTRIYYAWNCLGNASNVVTVTFAGSATYRVLVTHQFSGIDAASDPLGSQQDASGSGTSIATSSITVTAAEEVIFGFVTSNANSNVAGTGYTGVTFSAVGDSVTYFMDEYHIVTASEAATATCASGGWYIRGVSFKGATAATGQPTMRRWGGVRSMGGRGIGNKGSGRMWGQTRSCLYVPNHFREAA